MKYKHVVLSLFVFIIFNLFALSPFSRSNPAPKWSPGLYGQSVDLVKLKEEEEERKKKTKKSVLVVTNESLDKIETPNKPYGIIKAGGKSTEKGAETSGGDTGTQNQTVIEDNTPPDAKADDAGSASLSRQSKTYWQDRVNSLLDEIEKTNADIEKSRLELSLLNNDLQAVDIYQKRREIEKKMAELRKHIPEAKQKLADLNKAMEDLEDQARKENIPTGWLRVDRPETEKKEPVGQSDRKQKG